MGMVDRKQLEALFTRFGYNDFRWMNPKGIVVSEWVRMKCIFGCGRYGRNASCPPNTLPVDACRRLFDEYSTGVIFHFHKALDNPGDRGPWSREVNSGLLELEREVFLSGHHKTLLLFMSYCNLCDECTGDRAACEQPRLARPTPEAMAVDVFATVRQCGLPIQVLTDYTQAMNRYAFLLIE